MSYYPLLKAPGCTGWVTLCNFSPNNWESADKSPKKIGVTWSESGEWRSASIGVLPFNQLRTVCADELVDLVPTDALALLSIGNEELPSRSATLPSIKEPKTIAPAWRASLGLSTSLTSTSYQGEIDPFPAKGSLLTFGPFMQVREPVKNYLILLNVESAPDTRHGLVEIFGAEKLSLQGTFPCSSNNLSIIPLDDLGFKESDLPLAICRSMSAIPLYFSKTADGAFLSLEHTHPPASLVVHGQRWGAQKLLKNHWFQKTSA